MKKIFSLLFIIINWYSVSYTQNAPAISKEVLSDILTSIPSPLEMSFLIKDLGIAFEEKLLNSPTKANNYNTKFKQALNLGVYGADLGYAYIFEQKNLANQYLEVTKNLSQKLQINQLLEEKNLKNLTQRPRNIDSLLFQTNESLENINDKFTQNGQAELTISLIVGGWLEVLYQTCKIAQTQPNESLNNRIGEQKINLDQLLLLLSFYEEKSEIKNLIRKLEELQTAYEKVKISYEYEEPQTKEENGFLIVVDNTKSEIYFTPEMLQDILEKVEEIRKYIIN